LPLRPPSGRNIAALGPSYRLPTRLSRRVRCWWSRRCTDSRPVALLCAVIFVVPAHRHPRLQPRHLPRRWSLTSAHGLRHLTGFFLAYFENRCCAFSGNLHGHFWLAQVSPTTPPTV
jgi:hypothetical protein